jgi:hypothetical protein
MAHQPFIQLQRRSPPEPSPRRASRSLATAAPLVSPFQGLARPRIATRGGAALCPGLFSGCPFGAKDRATDPRTPPTSGTIPPPIAPNTPNMTADGKTHRRPGYRCGFPPQNAPKGPNITAQGKATRAPRALPPPWVASPPTPSSPERQRREASSDAENGLRADRSRIRENSECSQIIRILTNSATKMLHGVA